jgi:serine/threonine-protein kinase
VAQAATHSSSGTDGAAPKDFEPRIEHRQPDPLIGRVISDRYRIVGHVGRGGMGVVYKVEHLRIGKLMAMKLLTGELSRNKDVVRRFKREALAASRLTSINTVQVWDFGHADGLTYLVMELIAGEDLGKILKREGPMPFRRAAQIAIQVCNSMIEAHERGIVHRDIKPENVLIVHPGGAPDEAEDRVRAESGVTDLVKVLDFGLAKLHDDERPHTNDVTTSGAIVGTPFYMSPEQIRGEQVDGRADIYALGAVLYRAITGVPPFTAPTPMAVLTQHLTEEVVPPHERAPQFEIPKQASEIILKAMAKDRDARYSSAAELREALIGYLAAMGVSGGFLRSGALEAIAATSLPEVALEKVRPSRAEDASALPATRGEMANYSRRRKQLAILALVGAAALAVLVYSLVRIARSAHPAVLPNEELEPNDTREQATALTLGTPARGYLGKRIGPDRPDVDWWSFEVEDSLIDVALTPLPNMGMCLEIDGIFAACEGRGRAIAIPALRVKPGRHAIKITQDRGILEDGAPPPVLENVSDTYALRVAIAAPLPDLEIEPNDSLDRAQLIAVGEAVHARITGREDRDVFCAATGSGEARFVVVDRAERPRLFVEQGGVRTTVGEGGVRGERFALEGDVGPKRCVTVGPLEGTKGSTEPYRVSLER